MVYKRSEIKDMVSRNKVTFLCIQESRMLVIRDRLICSVWGNRPCNYVISDQIGSSGGLVFICDPRLLDMDFVNTQRNHIVVAGIWKPRDVKCGVITVYALNITKTRLICGRR